MTRIVGILNITPDSFSDGGRFTDIKRAIDHFEKMISDGADVIDIGAQSTRPGANIISSDEEWQRLEPLLNEIENNNYKVEISIDSFNHATISRALDYNISYINDVSGCSSDEMKDIAARSGKKIIFMHNLGIPADKAQILPDSTDIISFLSHWLEDKIMELENSGIKKEKMIFDPGIGFGKTHQQNLEIIMGAEKFKRYGVEVMVGHSEKSFLSLFTSEPAGKRGDETKRFSRMLAEKNIDYIRVHDVSGNKEIINSIK